MSEATDSAQPAPGDPARHPDLAEAVAAARSLLARLADDLDGRDGADVAAAVAALRDTQPVLDRLAGQALGPDIGAASTAGADRRSAPGLSGLVMDVSDLLGYFRTNRLPTGIQRVQAELIYNILSAPDGGAGQLCCFVEARDVWVTVSAAKFLDICAMSRAGGDAQEPRWRLAVDGLRAEIDASPAFVFPQDATLVNVGSSWWLPNYFLYIRRLKEAFGVRYVPLIYDLIPILTPENCDPELVEEFIGWFLGVLDHADYYFAISEATKADLIAYAATIGRTIPSDRVTVIPLNADFRPPAGAAHAPKAARRLDEPYVLFVSTLEARKNQLGALDAWSALMAKHGPEKIPKLVLVGKRGFHSDLILQRLDMNQSLRERVVNLASVDDSELQTLYRDCLFTIYPSFYEGWGLPVTESLCYGKVPLVANNSSLPEAGDRFAVYFETGSTAALVAAIERMLFDPAYKQQREQLIRDFAPMKWADVARKVTDGLQRWAQQGAPPAYRPLIVEAGAYYPLRRNRSRRVWRGSGSAETLRHGLGWYVLEDHGCWVKPEGAEIAFRLPSAGPMRIGLELICAPRSELHFRIEARGTSAIATGRIADGPAKWVFLDIAEPPADGDLVILLSATVVDQPDLGWNGDRRPLTVGLRGLFVFGDEAAFSRLDFVETVALGALADFNVYRDRSMEAFEGRD